MVSDSILRPLLDVEHDSERAVSFLARGSCIGFPVALLVEERPDALDRILDQILVYGCFAGDRNELRALFFRQRISVEGDGDDRTDLKRDREINGAIVRRRSRLVGGGGKVM